MRADLRATAFWGLAQGRADPYLLVAAYDGDGRLLAIGESRALGGGIYRIPLSGVDQAGRITVFAVDGEENWMPQTGAVTGTIISPYHT